MNFLAALFQIQQNSILLVQTEFATMTLTLNLNYKNKDVGWS